MGRAVAWPERNVRTGASDTSSFSSSATSITNESVRASANNSTSAQYASLQNYLFKCSNWIFKSHKSKEISLMQVKTVTLILLLISKICSEICIYLIDKVKIEQCIGALMSERLR